MDKNVPSHKTRIVQEVLRNNNSQRINYPTTSQDMHMIEHVCCIIKKKEKSG